MPIESSILGGRGLSRSLELVRGLLEVAQDVLQGGSVWQSAAVAIAVQWM